MAGKKSGSSNDFFNKPFGGMFDFNWDGKEDLSEIWLGQRIIEEASKGAALDADSADFDAPLYDDDFSWGITSDDGTGEKRKESFSGATASKNDATLEGTQTSNQSSHAQRENRKAREIMIVRGILCVIVLITVAMLVILAVDGYMQRKRLEETYARAEALVQGGEYAEALNVLEGLDDSYRNVEFLTYYSSAHVNYDQGKLSRADDDLFQCDRKIASGEIMPEGYEEFRTEVAAEYAAYAEEQLKKMQEEYRNKVRTGVPFVGMSESDIANTSLGAPSSKVGHNTEWVHGERVTTNLYYFYENRRMIFSARCYFGSVKQVWDHRNEPPVLNMYYLRKTSKQQEDGDDPFNAKDYLFPEDFYEDHLDDFYDFEDAEDYYYDHGGK